MLRWGRNWAAQWCLARTLGRRFRGFHAKRLYVHNALPFQGRLLMLHGGVAIDSLTPVHNYQWREAMAMPPERNGDKDLVSRAADLALQKNIPHRVRVRGRAAVGNDDCKRDWAGRLFYRLGLGHASSWRPCEEVQSGTLFLSPLDPGFAVPPSSSGSAVAREISGHAKDPCVQRFDAWSLRQGKVTHMPGCELPRSADGVLWYTHSKHLAGIITGH